MTDFVASFRPTDNFSTMGNWWFRDPRLSDKAKGRLAYLATHAAGYRVTMAQQIAETADGRDSVYASLRELVDRGYLVRHQPRDARGKVGTIEYRWGPAVAEQQYERAWGRESSQVFPLPAPPEAGNPATGSPLPAPPDPAAPDPAMPTQRKNNLLEVPGKEPPPRGSRTPPPAQRQPGPNIPGGGPSPNPSHQAPVTGQGRKQGPTRNRKTLIAHSRPEPGAVQPGRPTEDRDQLPEPTDGQAAKTARLETNELEALAQHIQDERNWPIKGTISAMREALAAGRTWPQVGTVMRRVAADPTSRSARRLLAALPNEWWDEAGKPSAPARPDWCGECDMTTRQIELRDDSQTVIRCPKCHPLTIAAASARDLA